MTLTPEGRAHALDNPHYVLDAEDEISIPAVQTLGVYAVLGPYDFVTIVEAAGNEDVARFSIELGVKAGLHITTLPVIPAARLDRVEAAFGARAGIEVTPWRDPLRPSSAPEMEPLDQPGTVALDE